jgi:hypothetical protein
MSITPSICINKTSNNNKDTHSQEKIEKGEIEKKDHIVVMKHSQQQRSNHHQTQHLDCG